MNLVSYNYVTLIKESLCKYINPWTSYLLIN